MAQTIKTVKFHRDSQERGVGAFLRVDNHHLLEQSLRSDSIAVFVIADTDLGHLAKSVDLIKDLGQMNDAEALSRYFYQRDKIPMIKGKYRNLGNIGRGINAFLKYTYKNKQQKAKASILVVHKDQFHKLWMKTPCENQGNAIPTPQSRYSTCSIVDEIINRKGIDENKLTELAEIFAGNSEAAKRVRLDILIAASHKQPVLIIGETGTGKNIVARAIHDNSTSRENNIVTINCGAISSELVHSELFGHKKGAFTSATRDREGLIQSAHEGTLFLDEIGDMPLDQQVKMLHVLEDAKYRRVGGEIEKNVDVRVVAATNRDLYTMVRTGRFRSDLLYRLLRGTLIRTPCLRDHIEDIACLAQYLWDNRIKGKAGPSLPDEIFKELQKYRWPGNVRELSSVLCGLHSYFGENDLGIKHLKYIFQIQGQMNETRDSLTPLSAVDPNPPACLRHLKQTENGIRSIQALLEPLSNSQQSLSVSLTSVLTTLPYRIHELEILIRHPLLFSNEATFAVINQLKGSLDYFHSLIKEGQSNKAQHLLTDKLIPQLDSTLTILSNTAGTLVN